MITRILFTLLVASVTLSFSGCTTEHAIQANAMGLTLDDANSAFDAGKYVEAERLYRPLAEQGDALAQRRLGVMYVRGLGVARDYQAALKWHRLSAEQGNALSQDDLGLMYLKGQGVPNNSEEAAKWFLRSAEQGNPQAQNDLGMMYFYGEGVTKNIVLAYMWLKISNDNPVSTKAKQLEKHNSIVRQMNLQQFTLAIELVEKCTANKYKNCEKLFDQVQGTNGA